jgi:hypothetical protein
MRFSTALAGSVILAAASAQLTGGLPNLSSALAEQSSARNSRSSADATATGSVTGTATNGPERTASLTSVITGGVADTQTAAVPTITGPAGSDEDAGLPSGLPTLAGAYKIIPASVPPLAGAPYMQTSSLPEGTVFIAVGAILGFFAMSVLLWRALVAWSLHRSVKRATQHTVMSDTKALFGQNSAPVYAKFQERDSMIDLAGSGGKSGKKSGIPTMAPNAASASSLFFSPTAGAAMNNAGNRGSNYLPAGYYAAGASAPNNNQSHVSLGQGPAISLSNLARQSQGYSRARSIGPSPPESPGLYHDEPGMHSSSTLNLNRSHQSHERPPSAYLDEMFDVPQNRQSRHERF